LFKRKFSKFFENIHEELNLSKFFLWMFPVICCSSILYIWNVYSLIFYTYYPWRVKYIVCEKFLRSFLRPSKSIRRHGSISIPVYMMLDEALYKTNFMILLTNSTICSLFPVSCYLSLFVSCLFNQQETNSKK